MTDDVTKVVERAPGSFFAKHPFVLSDGRRFMTAQCAALSAVYNENKRGLTMHDEWTGKVYSHSDCVQIVDDMETRRKIL